VKIPKIPKPEIQFIHYLFPILELKRDEEQVELRLRVRPGNLPNIIKFVSLLNSTCKIDEAVEYITFDLHRRINYILKYTYLFKFIFINKCI